jgi:hypothetical protein
MTPDVGTVRAEKRQNRGLQSGSYDVYLDADRVGRILGVEFLDFADFRRFLERNGGRVDIPAHIGDLDASKLISM